MHFSSRVRPLSAATSAALLILCLGMPGQADMSECPWPEQCSAGPQLIQFVSTACGATDNSYFGYTTCSTDFNAINGFPIPRKGTLGEIECTALDQGGVVNTDELFLAVTVDRDRLQTGAGPTQANCFMYDVTNPGLAACNVTRYLASSAPRYCRAEVDESAPCNVNPGDVVGIIAYRDFGTAPPNMLLGCSVTYYPDFR